MDKTQTRGFLIFEGILFLILGFFAVAVPQIFTLGVELMIGWLFIIGGLTQAYRAIKAHGVHDWMPLVLSALLYIGVGILMLVYPLTGVLSLTMLLTFFFIVEGIIKITRGIQLRHVNNNWAWLVFSGFISLAMGFIIISGWPSTVAWVIGLLVGINMVFFGMSLLFLAFNPNDRQDQNKSPLDKL